MAAAYLVDLKTGAHRSRYDSRPVTAGRPLTTADLQRVICDEEADGTMVIVNAYRTHKDRYWRDDA